MNQMPGFRKHCRKHSLMRIVKASLLMGILLALGAAPAWSRPATRIRPYALIARLRRDGERAIASKNFDSGARSFSELYRRTLRVEGLYLLGKLAYAEGRLLAAQDLMSRYLDDPGLDRATSVLEQREARRILSLARPPSGQLHIIGQRGSLISIDERLTGALPLAHPLLLAPGAHTLSLELDGVTQAVELEVRTGRLIEATYASSSAALLFTEQPGVLLSEDYGSLKSETSLRLGQALKDIVSGERMSAIPMALELSDDRQAATECAADPECQLQIARQNKLTHILSVQVSQPELAVSWHLRLTLADVEVGAESARSEKECLECSPEKAIELLRASVPELISAARSRERGMLAVSSFPAGAIVRSGDRVLGRTPFQHAAWVGTHELELILPGYQPARRSLEVSADKQAAVQVELKPEPPARSANKQEQPSPPPKAALPPLPMKSVRPRWRLGLGGALLGSGALLSGFGISALAVSDQCTAEPQLPAVMCRQLYGTSGAGVGLLASGTLSSVAGALLLIIPEPRRIFERLRNPSR